MTIKLWPKDYERKNHISKEERLLLRLAERNFQHGDFVVNVDPVGLATPSSKMGFYISPKQGLITYSICSEKLNPNLVDNLIMINNIYENKIYDTLLNSKVLISRDGNTKFLRFPYKHIYILSKDTFETIECDFETLQKLNPYACYKNLTPLSSKEKIKKLSQLKLFNNIRKPYDANFMEITELEKKAIFERLSPEYTIITKEIESCEIQSSNASLDVLDVSITGKELEYKTFYLDDYQVGLVNEIGTGHRVLLANPGAGKSVLLLSKAYKYASMNKDTKILLTCYNNNLADSYQFKKNCANFGENKNLYIMTFHKLVKKIYEECLKRRLSSNIATEDEIKECISLIKNEKINLKFNAIFIDEVQIFNPLFLELCYALYDDSPTSVFLMAGDLNQSVRIQSRRGDAPWKNINGVSLDFKGRVKYIEKNYRNSKQIGDYLNRLLCYMNLKLNEYGLINLGEYEYNSFDIKDEKSIALSAKFGIERMNITKETVDAVIEINKKYCVSYSEIAILFPYQNHSAVGYYNKEWIKKEFDHRGIPYCTICGVNDNDKRTYSKTSGVVLSTIDSSLGLDFKAVIVVGLYPYNYVFGNKMKTKISSWNVIGKMSAVEKEEIQVHMRKMYTACSRARDILYVLSDLDSNSPIEEVLKIPYKG